MTSSVNATNQDGEHIDVKESKAVTTIQRIYRDNPDDLVLRDPNNRRSFINRPAYAKLHRSFSSGNKRYSVDGLKGRFETLARQNSEEQPPKKDPKPVEPKKEEPKVESPTENETREVFTPASFGYPKTAKLVPPLIKPKPPVRKRPPPKDVNSNVVNRTSVSSDEEQIRSVILQPSASEESVDKIAKELSSFTMDGKPKDKKRVGSFRKLFLGGLFSKDKKKKDEDRNKQKASDNIYTDNIRNESNFTRQSPLRQTLPTGVEDPYAVRPSKMQEYHERKIRELELEYAQRHVDRFNSIRQNFNEDKTENYVIMDKPKPSITDFISTPVNKYIDTSSSASVESEKPNGVVARDTPPRAQETYQNISVVKPKVAAIPINSERPLPNPFQNEKDAPRTIERNLNKSESKDYPDKANVTPTVETYGTVFDNLAYTTRNGDTKPVNNPRPLSSPKSPISLESTKLKLPPNREIYEPQPRVKSPIPTNKVSTDKIIATELLKNTTRSPTPPKRVLSKSPDDLVAAKPPMSPKSPKRPEPHFDRIVTNAVVHAPQRSQTPVDNRTYSNVTTNPRASTPVDLRMSVAMKMASPKKEDVKKSVEEYYWKQLKKLKEEEDQKLYAYQMNGYYEEQSRLRRSRSLSPSSHRGGRRSLSLPRDPKAQNYVEYGRVQQEAIPEDQAITVTDGRNSRYFVYDQNFVRNNPERRSADSLQRPIFRRGSLTKQEIYESSPYNKRVSFSSPQAPQQSWPTRNGYPPVPPQRRVDPDPDDEVFFQPSESIYATRYSAPKEPLYSNRVLEQFRAQQYQHPLYGLVPYQMGDRRLSMDSLSRQQEIYGTRNNQAIRRMSNVPQYDPPNVQRYPSNNQLALQRNPVYSSRQSMTDSNYGQKQVIMRNKFCDIYGQIHDAPQSGIVMGQLQSPPMVPQRQPDNFVRGSRLTASANDIGKRQVDPRYVYDTNYNQKVENNYENRPLPPLPRQTMRNAQISDTESGSDISEIRRIMQKKTKKRSFFGK